MNETHTMRELSDSEIESVAGGLIPLLNLPANLPSGLFVRGYSITLLGRTEVNNGPGPGSGAFNNVY